MFIDLTYTSVVIMKSFDLHSSFVSFILITFPKNNLKMLIALIKYNKSDGGDKDTKTDKYMLYPDKPQ